MRHSLAAAACLIASSLLTPLACAKGGAAGDSPASEGGDKSQVKSMPSEPAPPLEAGQAEAIFAGGCFWCMEKPFDVLDGVLATTSGYTDGYIDKPAYYDVARGGTGHTEAIRVVYDPEQITYARLLEVFWHNIDPTQANGQFCDKGTMYRSGIYTSDPAEKAMARASKQAVAEELGAEVVTEIRDKSTFWVAEEYHQDFYDKEPVHYAMYRKGCGRDARLKALWGDAAGG